MGARAKFTQADVKRALKGVQAAGVHEATIRLRPDGDIVIQIGPSEIANDGGPNPWDEVYDETPPAAA